MAGEGEGQDRYTIKIRIMRQPYHHSSRTDMIIVN